MFVRVIKTFVNFEAFMHNHRLRRFRKDFEMSRSPMRAERGFVVIHFVQKALRAIRIEAHIELVTARFGLFARGSIYQHGISKVFRVFPVKFKLNCDDIPGGLLGKVKKSRALEITRGSF